MDDRTLVANHLAAQLVGISDFRQSLVDLLDVLRGGDAANIASQALSASKILREAVVNRNSAIQRVLAVLDFPGTRNHRSAHAESLAEPQGTSDGRVSE